MATTMPTRASGRTLAECTTLADALGTQEMLDRLRQAVPRHLSPERMLRVMVLAVSKTPELNKVPLREILGAMITLASLGMEPNTPLQQAWMIPFKKSKKTTGPQGREEWVETTQVQVVIGYRGFIDLARRTGSLVSIHADVVYDGDEFSFEYGSRMHLRHVPGVRRGKPIYAYAHAKLNDGEAFEVLPYEEVLKIRDTSEGYQYALKQKNAAREYLRNAYLKNPWVAFEHEMAAKTMVRRLAKMLPMSIEFATATQIDAGGEAGLVRWESAIDSDKPLDSVDIEDSAGAIDHQPEQAMPTKVEPQRQAEPQRQPEPVHQGARQEDGMEVEFVRQSPEPAKTDTKPTPEVVVLRMVPGRQVEDFLDFQKRFTPLVDAAQTIDELDEILRRHREQLEAMRKNDIVRYDGIMERAIQRKDAIEQAGGAPAAAK